MRIVIGSDHAGFRLKEQLKKYLVSLGHDFVDVGTASEMSCDYPDFAKLVAQRVSSGEFERGVLACGTGIGMCIAANKVNGVRAALVHDPVTARLAWEHNQANVLCLGSRLLAAEYACELVMVWLNAQFEERHRRRVDKVFALESFREGK